MRLDEFAPEQNEGGRRLLQQDVRIETSMQRGLAEQLIGETLVLIADQDVGVGDSDGGAVHDWVLTDHGIVSKSEVDVAGDLATGQSDRCGVCALKPRCTRAPARKVPRSIFEWARDMARGIMASDEGRTSKRQRKKVETLFAHLKRILKLDRLRLPGPCGGRDNSHRTAAAQNLRETAKLIPLPYPQPA